MFDTYLDDVIDELLDNEYAGYAVDDEVDEGIRDYVRRLRRWWPVFSAVRALTSTDPTTHQPIQREVPVLPAPQSSSTERRRDRTGSGTDRADWFDTEIDGLVAEYLAELDEGESSGPCYDTFLWCLENTPRRPSSSGQSVCQACWDLCREGVWPKRAGSRVCPSPIRPRRRQRRKARKSIH